MTPRLQPVGDVGVILRFGSSISTEIHREVMAWQQAVTDAAIVGVTELIPSYAALFIGYDPLVTDADTLSAVLTGLEPGKAKTTAPTLWQVPVCYEPDLAPDLEEVATRTGMSIEAVINAHMAGDYMIYMYGFAPGYAYLGGVPEVLQLPRKENPQRGVPEGTVCIAGPQSLVTTMTLPNGWWRLGRTAFRFLRPEAEDAFPLAVGDRVAFTRVSRDEYEHSLQRESGV